MHLDKNLSKLCKERQFTIAELARQSGVSKSTLHGWMNGVKVHNLDHLRSLDSVLQISLYRLLFDEDDPFRCADEKVKEAELEGIEEIFRGDIRVLVQRIKR